LHTRIKNFFETLAKHILAEFQKKSQSTKFYHRVNDSEKMNI